MIVVADAAFQDTTEDSGSGIPEIFEGFFTRGVGTHR